MTLAPKVRSSVIFSRDWVSGMTMTCDNLWLAPRLSYPGITCGSFHDRRTRLENAGCLGVLDNPKDLHGIQVAQDHAHLEK
jgi:hypothetical protein